MPLPPALEKVVGKPWTAWGSLTNLPSETPVSNRNGEISSGKRNNNVPEDNVSSLAFNTHSRRLNRSEMVIFGSCPGTERLTLMPCNFCGDKFKCPALADHVRLRHGGSKKPLPKPITPDKKKSPNHIRNKGKHGRFVKEKEKIVDPPVLNDSESRVSDWSKTNEVEEPPRVEREISMSALVPQFMLKQSTGESVKESPKSAKESKSKQKKSKTQEPSMPTILEVAQEKSPSSLKRDVELSPSRVKDKFKTEHLSKRPKLDPSVPSLPAEDVKPKSEEKLPVLEPPKLVPEPKTPEPKKKKGQKSSNMRGGGRIYDPDSHCGVLGKDSSKPCTRSLICKLHSIALRKSVPGRSKPFDVLLAALQKEKELERNRALEAEAAPVITKPPPVKVIKVPDVIEVEVKPRSPKVEPKLNLPTESIKISVPVSIKNPSLWTQLPLNVEAPPQSAQPPKLPTHNNTTPLLKKAVTSSFVQRVVKEEKAKEIAKPPSVIRKTPKINGFQRAKDVCYKTIVLPGFRKSSGLLSTSLCAPKMSKEPMHARMSSSRDLSNGLSSRRNYLLYLSNSVRDAIPDLEKDKAHPTMASSDFLKVPSKNVLSSMPSVSAHVNTLNVWDKNIVNKPLNLFGPLNGTAVLPLGLRPPMIKDRVNAVDAGGAGILHGDILTLQPPRTHFFTPSGPISLAVEQTSLSPFACKSFQPKHQHLPNTTSSIIYLQRTLKTVY